MSERALELGFECSDYMHPGVLGLRCYGFCVFAGGLGGVLRGSSLSGKQR